MKNLKKYNNYIFSTLILLVLVSAFFVFLINKIDLKSIKGSIKANVASVFPNSLPTVEKLDYSLRSKIIFQLDEIGVKDKSGLEVLSLRDVKCSLSYWTLISGEGALDISAGEVKLYRSDINSWIELLPGAGKKNVKLNLPNLIFKSKVNIYLNNISVFNRTNLTKEIYSIERLKLKRFSMSKDTAFESVIFKHPLKSVFEEAHVLGSINLKKILNEGKVSGVVSYKLKNLKYRDKSFDLKGNSKFDIDKLESRFEGKVENRSLGEATMTLSYQQNEAKLSHIEGYVFVDQIVEIFPEFNFIHNDTRENKLGIEGSIKLTKEEFNPELILNSSDNLSLNLLNIGEMSGKLKGKLTSSSLSLSSKVSFFDGLCDLVINSEYDGKKSSLSNFNGDVICNNQKINRAQIKDIVNWEKENAQTHLSQYLLPQMNINFKALDFGFEESNANISGRILINEHSILFKNIEFDLAPGKIWANIHLEQLEESRKRSYQIKFKDIASEKINAFYPPHINDLSGKLNGEIDTTINGNILESSKIDLVLNDGHTVALSLTKLFEQELTDLNLQETSSELEGKIDRHFKKIILKASGKKNQIKLSEFYLVGENNNYFLNLKGHVGLTSEIASEVKGSFNYGKVKIPFDYSGMGLKLQPKGVKSNENKL